MCLSQLQAEEWEDDPEHCQADMEHVMLSKATELFTLCDTEGKVRPLAAAFLVVVVVVVNLA